MTDLKEVYSTLFIKFVKTPYCIESNFGWKIYYFHN
ncbi:hypothetical protein PASE110613_10285 [Paenibacillus sediminis]|uniref:Uncharacterized protein n=1 Tax=Paenibacillus sediminis TaxID=664909 RepID=A0ABS4H5I5_9BACL|nr:hypothetical protein [Paenibacillus sediminis]